MKRLLIVGTLLVAGLGGAHPAAAQARYAPLSPPSFEIRPALPESMPTVSPYSDSGLAGTSMPTIAATPGCGAANPQGGIPSMVTGTCP
jgi:hypothetical protein